MKIGVSMLTRTLLDEPKDGYRRELLEHFGGAWGLLSYLASRGVGSIELRDMGSRSDIDGYERAARLITDASLGVSMHISITDTPPEDCLRELSGAIEIALRSQDSLVLTVHPCAEFDDTLVRYSRWADAFSRFDSRLVLCLENQRIRKADDSFKCVSGIEQLVSACDSPARGICWDMGHYAYNILTKAESPDTFPSQAALALVRHTHVHSLNPVDNDTHFPLTQQPVRSYINILKGIGYDGIYNLELASERYAKLIQPSSGLIQSLDTLEMILDDA